MEELMHYSGLYDIYKGLLTDKQRSAFEDYYFDNLTLDEIASNNGVSKNAVSKTIKQIKASLDDFESKLHFKEYMDAIKNEFVSDEEVLIRILKYDNIVI